MRRVVFAEVWNRRGRSLALLVGILVATAAFAVFTGTSDTQQLVVRGTVARSFRSSYDVLVRPRGSESAIERSQGLVRDNYLSGIFGGITTAQYQRIRRIPGVAIAAPIAMIGYVLQPVSFHIDLTGQLRSASRQLFGVQVVRRTDRGLTRRVDQRGYMYVTSRPIAPSNEISGATRYVGPTEQLGGGHRAVVCPMSSTAFSSPDPFGFAERGIAACWSRKTGLEGGGWSDSGFARGHVGITVDWSFPFLLAAIDPTAEAKLDGVNRTVISGRYLRDGDAPQVRESRGGAKTNVPVLASTRPYMDDQDRVTIRRLSATAARGVDHASLGREALGRLAGATSGPVVLRRTLTTAQAYRRLLGTIDHQQIAVIQNYWTSGSTRYRTLGPRTLAPVAVRHPVSVWRSDYEFSGAVDAPIDSATTGYRPLRAHVGLAAGQRTLRLPTLRAVGNFDPQRLPGFSPLSRLPLETYNPPVARAANARTRRLLGGRQLLPDANLAGYLQAPPLLLTTLSSVSAFTDPSVFPRANAAAPISVIRVRVAGVRGDDALSRERVRLVAQRIEQASGLQVDDTIGSSPTPVRIDLPASSGRPALALTEGWVKKGVAVAIIRALDRKSAILFALILIVCALFVYNAASASVHARRPQLGVLSCLGWTGRELFTVILGELAALGLIAGVLGAALALPISAAAGFHGSVQHAALAIPAAVALALLAGVFPALRAASMTPTAAIRPMALRSRRAWAPRGITQLALVNIARVPGRSLLAALSLATGVGALTLLLAITLVFHNALTGTLLGSALSLQVRGSDYAAVGVIVLLAAASVADVLYLNLRERASEIATLQATGWTDRSLARLIGTEALWLGLLGSLTGAAAGILGASAFAGTLPHRLVLIGVLAALIGVAVTIIAAVIPSTLIARIPTVPLLAGD